MSKIIDSKTMEQLKQVFNAMPNPVNIVFFTQHPACPTCREQLSLLEEVAAISDKITLKVYDLVTDGDMAMKYHVTKIPATIIEGDRDYGIRFFGITAGYEFTSLIDTLLMVSTRKSGLDPELEKLLSFITKPLHLQVMITLTCPYCPKAVHTAHQFAMANKHIKADMVDATEFPTLSQRYDVSGVPKTVINDDYSFVGALPAEAVYLEILKAVQPEEYRKIEETIREAKAGGKIKKADESHHYETIIVGGGPAAMSAAVYAARKELDGLLIANDLGGQITFTAQIDNYLGMPGISGSQMAELFRDHLDQYPFARKVGHDVVLIEKKDGKFHVVTEDAKKFTANSILYCAGKEYRRLGVPGEERFIGHGIAFCATCDAPLYKGKNVAVVGGGNSAFTAVRDLIDFASQIYLIHRRDTFKADSALVEEVKKAKNVRIYTNTVVNEVLGREKLTGARLVKDGNDRFDLLVDGIFLEIGLIPNSAPVKNLVELNEKGEIPIVCDNSTKIKGFYAAGDVTDVEEKQIAIAVGDGAKAALSAHKYLIENKLTSSSIRRGESWQ